MSRFTHRSTKDPLITVEYELDNQPTPGYFLQIWRKQSSGFKRLILDLDTRAGLAKRQASRQGIAYTLEYFDGPAEHVNRIRLNLPLYSHPTSEAPTTSFEVAHNLGERTQRAFLISGHQVSVPGLDKPIQLNIYQIEDSSLIVAINDLDLDGGSMFINNPYGPGTLELWVCGPNCITLQSDEY